tara:strand:+ start:1191 stop:1385 length:195 start_codon:yes stop_codon:yes gene_type:complete
MGEAYETYQMVLNCVYAIFGAGTAALAGGLIYDKIKKPNTKDMDATPSELEKMAGEVKNEREIE